MSNYDRREYKNNDRSDYSSRNDERKDVRGGSEGRKDFSRDNRGEGSGRGARDSYNRDREYQSSNRERDFDRNRDRSAGVGERSNSARHEVSSHNTSSRDSLLKEVVASADSDKSSDTIYISNLPKTVTDASLARFFGSVGTIKTDKKTQGPKVWIYKDKSTGLPKGDATVTYNDASASDGAINWFDGKPFEGNILKVEKAQAPKPPPGGWNARRGGRKF